MNFSGYFCLVAAAVLVVFAQQSEAGDIFDKITNYIEDGPDDIENRLDPGIKRYRDAINFIKQLFQEDINTNTDCEPSIKLREGFSNATQMLSRSRSTMLEGVLAAEKILGQDPEGARKLTQQSLVHGKSIAFNTGPSFYEGLARALSLSNYGARQGLLSAIAYIEKGAFAFFNTINSAERLFNDASEAGGKAAEESLDVYRLAIETGFAAIFNDVKKSANKSLQAVRDAQSSPIQLQIENRNCGVSARGDPECLNALKDINQVADNALKNGANPALVQELKEIVKCAFDSVVQIEVAGERILGNTKTIAETDTVAATTKISEEAEVFKKMINQRFSQLYLDFGSVCARSRDQSDKKLKSAFSVLEKGNVKIFNKITFIGQIVKTGLENGGDASMLAFETGVKAAYYVKLVSMQTICECAKVVFGLL